MAKRRSSLVVADCSETRCRDPEHHPVAPGDGDRTEVAGVDRRDGVVVARRHELLAEHLADPFDEPEPRPVRMLEHPHLTASQPSATHGDDPVAGP
jgi:hypothetical protein